MFSTVIWRTLHTPWLSDRTPEEVRKFVSMPQSDEMLGIRIPTLLSTGHREIWAYWRKCHSVYDFCIFISIFIQQIFIYWVLIRFQELLYSWYLLMGIHQHCSRAGVVYLWPKGHISVFSLILSGPEKRYQEMKSQQVFRSLQKQWEREKHNSTKTEGLYLSPLQQLGISLIVYLL